MPPSPGTHAAHNYILPLVYLVSAEPCPKILSPIRSGWNLILGSILRNVPPPTKWCTLPDLTGTSSNMVPHNISFLLLFHGQPSVSSEQSNVEFFVPAMM